MSRSRFVFVLEQSLGHIAHGRNIERELARTDWIDATVIRVDYGTAPALRRLPVLRTWSVRASWTARRMLERRLAQGRPDAIFIHTQVAALMAGEIARQVPTVVSLDATPVGFDSVGGPYRHRRGPSIAEAAKARVNRNAYDAAAALVTWCEWAADSLVADYGVPRSKIRVIPPGVDTDLFHPPVEGRASGPLRVLFVGGDFERKGGYDLLAAASRVRGPIELELVTGSSPSRIPNGVACRVHTGLRPQSPELVQLYQQADVFVLPSRGDCLPQAVAEALASGLPVIATDVGAMREMVRPGENGFLVPPGDVDALADGISALAESRSLRRAMAAVSLDIARAQHDARANNAAIFELLSELSGRESVGRTA